MGMYFAHPIVLISMSCIFVFVIPALLLSRTIVLLRLHIPSVIASSSHFLFTFDTRLRSSLCSVPQIQHQSQNTQHSQFTNYALVRRM